MSQESLQEKNQTPNISKLYEKIFTIKEMLAEAVNTSMEAANDAEAFGGEVSRVITSQLRQNLIPSIQKFIDDRANPAAASSLIQFLDSVPLAWIRIGPEQDPNASMTGASMIDQQYSAATVAMPSAQPTVPNASSTAEANRTLQTAGAGVRESSILKTKGESIREEILHRWQEEHAPEDDEGKLDFRALKETILNEPAAPAGLTPDMLVGVFQKEDRIFDRVREQSEKKEQIHLEEKDHLMGPGINEEGSSADFTDWKSLVDKDAGLEEALVLAKSGKEVLLEE